VSLDDFGALRVLYGLVAAGLIELAPGASEPPAAEEAPAPTFSLAVDLSPHRDEEAAAPPPPDEPGEAPPEPPDRVAAAAAAASFALEEDVFDERALDEDDLAGMFDAPAPEELTTEIPLQGAALEAPDDGAEAAFEEVPPSPDGAEAHGGSGGPEPAIDRAAAVRELAGLFGDDDRPRASRAAADGGRPAVPQRIEDDDQITKGLISRLIDGVKGL
jgi:hypothetical protein